MQGENARVDLIPVVRLNSPVYLKIRRESSITASFVIGAVCDHGKLGVMPGCHCGAGVHVVHLDEHRGS
jgi:hypothetical protein